MGIGEQDAQGRQAARALAFDCALTAAQGCGGLRDVEVLPEPQDHHRTLSRWDLGQRLEEDDPLLWVGAGRHCLWWAGRRSLAAPPQPATLLESVPDDQRADIGVERVLAIDAGPMGVE